MTKPLLAAALIASSLSLLAGCSSPSIITLNDGREIQTVDQPEYNKKTGFYEYEQQDGKEASVNKDEVLTIKRL
ncbi:YgdI/YgdR family lipoprotein [Pseudomonas sp. F1_0610]|uniref:YgdI/YgdR family lipoprotein n=1 Tax=Pseudomonas sp. F1_0610 TaxID=3114284 RepID=UPI0039C2AD1D